MSEMEFEQKQVELGRLLNDPGTPIQRDRIWALLEDLMAARPDSRALVASPYSWPIDFLNTACSRRRISDASTSRHRPVLSADIAR